MDNDQHEHGPSGPDKTWVEGDRYYNGFTCFVITKDQATEWNQEIAEARSRSIAAEISRGSFNPTSSCPKCRCTFPADVQYRYENAECQIDHGKSEHFDRECIRCGFVWAESI